MNGQAWSYFFTKAGKFFVGVYFLGVCLQVVHHGVPHRIGKAAFSRYSRSWGR